MSTNFPSSLDSYTTHAEGDVIDNTHVNNPQDAIVALETKVGVDSSAVTTTLDYKLKSTSSSDPGHKHTLASLSDFSVTSPTAGQSLVYNGSQWANTGGFKFGGTGADGALSITSGTTSLNLSSAAVTIKNYTSISITGSGLLNFSNPNDNGSIVILKSQGNVTLTSSSVPMIDGRGIGGKAGSGGASASPGGAGSGSNITVLGTPPGGGGNGSAGFGSGGAAGAATNPAYWPNTFYRFLPFLAGGGGGGGGGGLTGGGAGGNGGRGGGCIIIECGGAFNFTTIGGIDVSGTAGTNGSNGSGAGGGGGGGGGGAGSVIILYNTLTANTGTILSAGGANSSGGSGSITQGGSGGGGGGSNAVGNAGVTTSSGSNGGGGGAGGAGFSILSQNTLFA